MASIQREKDKMKKEPLPKVSLSIPEDIHVEP